MGGSPRAPDPRATSAAQTGTNVATALANTFMGQVNQNTPYGSTRYDQTGSYTFNDPYTEQSYDIPTFTQTTSLTPGGQRIQDATMGAQENYAKAAQIASGTVADQYATPFSLGANTPGLQTGPGGTNLSGRAGLDMSAPTSRGAGDIATSYAGASNFSKDRDKYTSALLERLQPSLDQARTSADANLIGRGVGIGSEAYGDTMDQLGRNENDARLAAILSGGEEQARMVGMARDAAVFGNQAQGQQYSQDMQTYGANNAARQQAYQNKAGAAATNFQTGGQAADRNNRARSQSVQEQFAMRSQGLNELGALLGQTQVAQPNFQTATPSQVQTTDVGSNIWNAYNANANRNSGLGSLLGSLTGLGMMAFA